ncbi:MAG: hypothetical protein JWQ96_267 [Segetibacter sp.]|nr:hypothetical protein [Segetibacter sp.]
MFEVKGRISMKTLNKPIAIMAAVFLLPVLVWLISNQLPSPETSRLSVITIKVLVWLLTGLSSIILVAKATAKIKKRIINTQMQYYNLFEHNPTPMAIVDLDTYQFVAVNKASINCYGYSLEELLKMKPSDIIVENKKSKEFEGKLENPSFNNEGIVAHRKKNGEVFYTEVSSGDVLFKNKKCRLLLARDISEIVRANEARELAEQESIKQRNFTSYVLENFPVDVAVFDKDHKYILLNKVAVKNDEVRKWLIGKDDFEYFKSKGLGLSIAEERRERFKKALDGESTEWVDEHTVNGEQKYILRKFYPYMQDGNLKYVYGYGMDITAVRKAQMQKDEYIDQLEKIAFATSHKIRQPICNIQGLISLLEKDDFKDNDYKNITSCMQKSVLILDDFTKELAIKLHEYKQQLHRKA